jgi:hypothetical protein
LQVFPGDFTVLIIKNRSFSSILTLIIALSLSAPAIAEKKDAKEYFAEMSESYYGVNDHYTFLLFELRQYDPNACELLAKLWKGKAK